MGQLERSQRRRLRDGLLTVVAVVLAFAALDDITTGSETDFQTEWVALAACGVWCGTLAWRLMHSGRRVLGILSLGVVAAGTLVLATGSGTVPSLPRYITLVASLAWFLAVAAVLLAETAAARMASRRPS